MKPSWDEYFSHIAQAVSTRASCPRATVGCVIVNEEHRILATGYNGAPSGKQECIEVGCDVVEGHCLRAVHAEMNAIAFAAKYGIPLNGGIMYVYDKLHNTPRSHGICRNCDNARIVAGVVYVLNANIFVE